MRLRPRTWCFRQRQRAARPGATRRTTLTSAFTAIWQMSRPSGGASRRPPTARRSRPSTGSRPGNGMSGARHGVHARRSPSAASRAATSLSCCRLRRAARHRRGGCACSAQDLCDYNAPLLAPDFSERVTADGFLRGSGATAAAAAAGSRCFRHDWIDARKDAAKRSAPSAIRCIASQRLAQLQRRQLDAARRRLGRNSIPRSARRRRAGATAPSSRHSRELRRRPIRQSAAEAADARAHARDADGAEEPGARPQGRRRTCSRAPAGATFFRDLATNPQHASRWCTSSRLEVGATLGGGQSRLMFGDCYYPRAGELRRRRASPTSGRARCTCASFSNTRSSAASSASTSPSATSATSSNGATASMKLYDHAAAATWRGWPAAALRPRGAGSSALIKQTPWVWNAVSAARTALGSFSRPARP